MRLAIFIFVCFAASTAVNSTQSNFSGTNNQVEKLRAIPSDIPRLPPSNFSLARRLRQEKVDQPEWCTKLVRDVQTTEEVMANCKTLSDDTGFKLRIDQNVTEEKWKKFIGNVLWINTIVYIIDSPLTEMVMVVSSFSKYADILNNSKLERIDLTGKEKSNLRLGGLYIKGNPALKSIKFEAEKSLYGDGLEIIDNSELETIEINAMFYSQSNAHDYNLKSNISNNPKLRRVHINIEITWTDGPIHIVGNRALIELIFPETLHFVNAPAMYIIDNDNLESIKFPETSNTFRLYKLEIRQNDNLKTIDLGEETRWKDTELVVRENALLSSETLETLKKIQWKTKDIQDVGEGLTTTTTTTTTSPETATSGEETIPIAILPILVILGL